MFLEILKFCFRFIKHLAMFSVSLVLQLIGAIVLLVVCLDSDIGKLPRCLRWFDSADPFVGRDTTVITRINGLGYWSKYCWLAWRNPLNYYGYVIEGKKVYHKAIVHYQNRSGQPEVGTSYNDVGGLYYVEADFGDGLAYEYYLVYPYKLFGIVKCIRFRMGWKVDYPETNKIGELQQQAFVFNPFATFVGKM